MIAIYKAIKEHMKSIERKAIYVVVEARQVYTALKIEQVNSLKKLSN